MSDAEKTALIAALQTACGLLDQVLNGSAMPDADEVDACLLAARQVLKDVA